MQGDELVESHQGPSLRQHTSRRHRRGTEAKLIEQGWFELPPKATHLRFTDPPPFDAGASWFGNLAFVAAATIRDELEPTVHKPVCNGFGMELRHLYTTARQASQANARRQPLRLLRDVVPHFRSMDCTAEPRTDRRAPSLLRGSDPMLLVLIILILLLGGGGFYAGGPYWGGGLGGLVLLILIILLLTGRL